MNENILITTVAKSFPRGTVDSAMVVTITGPSYNQTFTNPTTLSLSLANGTYTVKATKNGVTVSSTFTVSTTPPVFTALPGFIGNPVVGQLFIIDPGITSPQATSYIVVWSRNGVNFPNTGLSYKVVASDKGAIISAIITPYNGIVAGAAIAIPGYLV
jgi:hypothetical protein